MILDDSRFFSSGPVISYDPLRVNKEKLDPPPKAHSPRNSSSMTIGLVGPDTRNDGRKERSRVSRNKTIKAYGLLKRDK